MRRHHTYLGLTLVVALACVLCAPAWAEDAAAATPATTTPPAAAAAAGDANPITENNPVASVLDQAAVSAIAEEAKKAADLDDDEEDMPAPKPLTEEEKKTLEAWEGHLKPLGTGNTKTPAQEVNEWPTTKAFYTTYVQASVPLIIRGGALNNPAYLKWTDEYLSNLPNASDTRMVAEVGKKENRTRVEEPVYPTFTEFLKNYTSMELYVIHDMLPPMKADAVVPPPLDCPIIHKTFTRSLFHLNNGDTRSVLHHEHYDDIYCVLDGSKSFLLADPTLNKEHLTIDADDPETGEYIEVDVDSVDALKYPGMPKVTFTTASLNKGDCIYLPSVWLQADITGPGRHAGLSVWWHRDTESDAKVAAGDCPEAAPVGEARTTMDKVVLADEDRYNKERDRAEAEFDRQAQEAEADLQKLMDEDPAAMDEFARKLMEEVDLQKIEMDIEEEDRLKELAAKREAEAAAALKNAQKAKDEL